MAPNLLSFSDPTLLPEVYHLRAEKTEFYNPGIAGGQPVLLLTKKDKEHAAMLKTLGPTVSMAYIDIAKC